MARPLVPGLVAEGREDEDFLGAVIYRQLRELTLQSATSAVDVEPTQIGSCRSIRDHGSVAEALAELSADCHVLFVHNDFKERHKAAQIIGACRLRAPVVGLVPVKETEAWLLADRHTWAGIRGANLDALPARPKDVEGIPDPKQALKDVIPRRGDAADYAKRIGQTIDLDTLAQVPAYKDWVTRTNTVLKGLGYL